MLQYNLTVERQLPYDMALTVAYAGSHGLHLMQEREADPLIPQGVPGAGGLCVARPGVSHELTSMIDGQATACWLTGDPRQNPAFGSTDFFVAEGVSHYNALQVGLNKRFTKGLQFQSSYTYAHAVDDNTNITGEVTLQTSSYPVDPFHQVVDRGPADFDLRHVWKFNAIYHFPSVNASNIVASKLLSGWWTSGILSLQTGLAFSPDLNANRSRSGVGGGTGGLDRPDLLPGRNNDNITSGTSSGCGTGALRGVGNGSAIAAGTPLGTPSLYFDPCAFTTPNAGFLGTVAEDSCADPVLPISTSRW